METVPMEPMDLLTREELHRYLEAIGLRMYDRRFAALLRAVGVREARRGPIDGVTDVHGATKFYYVESAWAMAAMATMSNTVVERTEHALGPYRLIAAELLGGDDGSLQRRMFDGVPDHTDRLELLATVLLAFSFEYGMNPMLIVNFTRKHRSRRTDWSPELSSISPGFIVRALDAYTRLMRDEAVYGHVQWVDARAPEGDIAGSRRAAAELLVRILKSDL